MPIRLTEHDMKTWCPCPNCGKRGFNRRFTDKDEAKIWIMKNQIGRRNLITWQRINLALELEDIFARKAKENERIRKGNQPGASLQNSANLSTIDTREELAVRREDYVKKALVNPVGRPSKIQPNSAEFKQPTETRSELAKLAKVGHDTIWKGKQIIERASEDAKERLRRGEASINEVYKEVKKKPRHDKERKSPSLIDQYDVGVRHGDFRTVLADIPPDSVKIILTDPPYGKKDLPQWGDLGYFAARTLRSDGALVAYSGQLYLPRVVEALEVHLDWWWLCGLIHEGTGNLTPLGQPPRKVINQFKPLRKALAQIHHLPRYKVRCYALLKYDPGETINQATARMVDIWEAGAMPSPQLYQPENEYINYPGEWLNFQRNWSRPAITKRVVLQFSKKGVLSE